MKMRMTRRSLVKSGVALSAGAAIGMWDRTAGAVMAPAAPRPDWLIGANTAIDGFGLFQAIETLRELNFSAIEIQPIGVPEPTPGQRPGFRFDQMDSRARLALKAALSSFDIVSLHLPWVGIDYFSASADLRSSSVHAIDIAMDAAEYYNCTLAVLHPQRGSGDWLTKDREQYLDRFRAWGNRAQRGGFRLAIETGFLQSVKDYVQLIREIDHPWVGGTLDVGHQSKDAELSERVPLDQRNTLAGIRAYNDINIEIVRGLGDKLIHLHCHDIDPATWTEHQPIIYSFIDYPRLFGALLDVNYRGYLLLEIGGAAEEMPAYLRESRQRLIDYEQEVRMSYVSGKPGRGGEWR